MDLRKLRWGVLGCASIAKRAVVPGVKGSELNEVYAIASRSIETAQATAKELEISNAYGSYEELIEDPNIDVVYIPLPNHLHKQWAIVAMRAGKHVLCEKPLALTAEEAQEMVDESHKAGVILAEAFMYRFHPRYDMIAKLIADGEIGEVRGIHSAFTFNNGGGTENVRFHKEWGGGSLYDVGCYPISAARLLLGTEPEAVTVQAMFSEKHNGVDMMASGLVEFPNDVSLIFDCGMWAAFRNPLEVLGTEGVIEVPEAFVTPTEESSHFYVVKDTERKKVEAPFLNAYSLQADMLARAVNGDVTHPFPIEDAVANMKVLEACLKSATEKARITM